MAGRAGSGQKRHHDCRHLQRLHVLGAVARQSDPDGRRTALYADCQRQTHRKIRIRHRPLRRHAGQPRPGQRLPRHRRHRRLRGLGRRTAGAAAHGHAARLPAFVRGRIFCLRDALQHPRTPQQQQAAAHGRLFAQRADGGLCLRQRPLYQETRLPFGERRDDRRQAQQGHQRPARLGLRRGIRLQQGLRVVGRQPRAGLHPLRRERSARI